ncbi:transporter substrate-binding domain-containing protein [Lonepinella sp. BR2271]|uniref:transporter substrate-binding domain-containing protein n=1 Tax=Lonepinella sp. BR2271 TaxID=3434550 RepID=UPI003F6DFD8A
MKITTLISKLLGGIVLITPFLLSGCDQHSASTNQVEKRKITVAHTSFYVPYDYINEKGESDGFEVAVIKEVAKKLPQYDFEFVPVSDDDLLIGVEAGKYTLGTKGIWLTESRKKKYVFPKHNIAASVIGLTIRQENANAIKNIDEFAKFSGKLVPIAPQSAQFMVITEYNNAHPEQPIKLVPSDTFQITDAYSWVLEGRYDGFLEIELSYKNNIQKADAPYHQFSDRLAYVRYKGIPTYPIFNRHEQQLADEYDKAIEQLHAEGKIAELELQYFGESLNSYIQ